MLSISKDSNCLFATAQYCTGKLKEPYTPSLQAKPTLLLSRAHNRSLAVYPFVFRNEVGSTAPLCRATAAHAGS